MITNMLLRFVSGTSDYSSTRSAGTMLLIIQGSGFGV